MLRHYLAVALLNLRKAPIAAFANAAVLALGLTAFVGAYAVTGFWERAERQFANADRTFVVASRISLTDGSTALYRVPVTNPYVAAYLRADFPQIETTARARSLGGEIPVAAGERAVRLPAVAVDAEFLAIFDLPFVAGDALGALAQPGSVVLTESAAQRLFGNESALGKTVTLGNRVDVTVTGVIGAIAEPSHLGRSDSASLTFDLLTSSDVRDRYLGAQDGGAENWFGMDGTTYVLLPADGSLAGSTLDAALDAFLARHMPAEQAGFAKLDLDLIPVTRMLALDASGAFLAGRGSITAMLWLFGALLLGIACVNYASLAAARATGRAHEVGVRKAIGASAGDVLFQHLVEAGLLTACALALAFAAVRAAAPVLRAGTGIDLTLALAAGPRSLAFLAALALGVTLLAGAYPAFVLSRVRPIFALRAVRVRFGRRLLLTLLVGVQYAAASFLLIAATFVYLQNAELKRANGRIAADPLLVVQNQEELTRLDFGTLRDELLRLPQVTAVTATNWWGAAPVPLARSADEAAPQRQVTEYLVSYDFAEVFDVPLLAGRFFERARGDDAPPRDGPSIVVDRALAEYFGFAAPEDAVGQTVYVPRSFMANFGLGNAAQPRHIVGVVENTALGIDGGRPGVSYRFGRNALPFTVARVSRDGIAGALAGVNDLWQRLVPGIAPNVRVADEIFAEQYARYARIAGAFTALCAFALLIAVIGLFAMAQVVSARRSHEIGVRKTLGAGTVQMIALLVNSFSLPVVTGSFVASLLGFFAMRRYLDGFLSPIELDVAPFAACLLAMLLIAWVTVGAQTLRAARTTPAQVLRHE